jgi:hypothetical protein
VRRDETGKRKKHKAPAVESVSPRYYFPELTLLMRGSAHVPLGDARAKGQLWIRLNLEGRFERASDRFCALIGYDRTKLLGKVFDGVTALATVHIPQHLRAVRHIRNFRCFWMFVHREGPTILVRSDWELIGDASFEVNCQLPPFSV